MEGKRSLYYPIKMCGNSMCRNYHILDINSIENAITTLFDVHTLIYGIIPKQTTLEKATHAQYIDITGTIHIRPLGRIPDPYLDIVNLRLLTLPNPYSCYSSIETTLVLALEAYEDHLQK